MQSVSAHDVRRQGTGAVARVFRSRWLRFVWLAAVAVLGALVVVYVAGYVSSPAARWTGWSYFLMLYAVFGVGPLSVVLAVVAAIVNEWRLLWIAIAGALLGVAAVVISHVLAPAWL